MAWVTVGVTAGSALLGAKMSGDREEKERQYAMANAEANRYAPWTGHVNQVNAPTSTALGGLLQGGLSGLALSQKLGEAGIGGPTKDVANSGSAYSNLSLGGNEAMQNLPPGYAQNDINGDWMNKYYKKGGG